MLASYSPGGINMSLDGFKAVQWVAVSFKT